MHLKNDIGCVHVWDKVKFTRFQANFISSQNLEKPEFLTRYIFTLTHFWIISRINSELAGEIFWRKSQVEMKIIQKQDKVKIYLAKFSTSSKFQDEMKFA